jgi:hypothetical protein
MMDLHSPTGRPANPSAMTEGGEDSPGDSSVSPFPGGGLFGLPLLSRSGRFLEELGWVHPQDVSQLPDDLQPDVCDSSLDPAHVGPVDSGVVGQLFLGQPPLMPKTAKVGGEELAQVHVPSQPTCGLTAHGFKAE